MKLKKIWLVTLLLLMVFTGNTLGKESADKEQSITELTIQVAQENQNTAEGNEDPQKTTQKIETNTNITGADTERIRSEEPNFTVKLGTFLLIVTVLLFVIRWQRHKNDD
ncbi:MAG: hypothetical protein ACRCU3_07790 [Eubacteriaceae bacterium]